MRTTTEKKRKLHEALESDSAAFEYAVASRKPSKNDRVKVQIELKAKVAKKLEKKADKKNLSKQALATKIIKKSLKSKK